jgi:hypothetical protein
MSDVGTSSAAPSVYGFGHKPRTPVRWDPLFAACGWAFPNASVRSCSAFAKDTRSQQALLLAIGVAIFDLDFFLFPLSYALFSYGLCLGSVVFALGLVYDVMLIRESRAAAEAARPTSGALADALGGRESWRWAAFCLNVVGSALTLEGCVFYVRAIGQRPHSHRFTHDVWLGNAWFLASFACFIIAFATIAADAVLTMREVAAATGTAAPEASDETMLVLFSFLLGLILFAAATALLLMPPGKVVGIAAALCGIPAVVLLTGATFKQLHMQWRDFGAGSGSFWEQRALEEEAVTIIKQRRASEDKARAWEVPVPAVIETDPETAPLLGPAASRGVVRRA